MNQNKSQTSSKRANRYSIENRLSHKLSGILRHGHDNFTDKIDENGWLSLDDLMQNSHFIQQHQMTFDLIERVVKDCPKQRFALKKDVAMETSAEDDLPEAVRNLNLHMKSSSKTKNSNNLKISPATLYNGFTHIKATQGHTIKINQNTALTKLTSQDIFTHYPKIVHGTYKKSIDVIQKTGLSKMDRNHIHFTASDQVDGQHIISGFRKNCEILIYLDVEKICQAIDQNQLEFFISENRVILSPGNAEGYILPEFFEKVVDRTRNIK